MSRAGMLWIVLAITLLAPSAGLAQTTTRRPIPAGEVTGLELGLEGATSVARGGTLRWFFTLYEVVGQDRLRPARGGRLRVLASFRPDEAIAELTTDARGRATVEVPVPADEYGFHLIVQASSGPVSRDFDTSIETTDPGRVELVADRTAVQPGETATFVGRALTLPSGRPAAGRHVTISVTDQDGRSLEPDRDVETGPSGAFVATFTAPASVTALRCSATIDDVGSASAAVDVARRAAPRMVVRAVPRERLVAPGARVLVDVTVRRGDGRPVRGAIVRTPNVPSADARETREVRTDASGRALLAWVAPRVVAEPVTDLTEAVSVERAGLGSARTDFAVRVAREPYLLGVSVEGGALMPGLPSRLYVRVTRSDGAAARDTPVHLESPLLGTLDARTNDDGVAVFDERPVVGPGLEGRDRCGGTTASSLVVTMGDDLDDPRSKRCVPIDPDGTVRVRPGRPVAASGAALDLELFVSARAARAPIEIALLQVDEASSRLVPVARHIVEQPGATRRASIDLPPDLAGEVLVRARPLAGPALEAARGGTAMVWVTPGARLSASVRAGSDRDAQLSLSAPRERVEGAVLVVPADEADALAARLRESMIPPFGQLLGEDPNAQGPLVEGWLAARTPRDEAAPTVLRDGGAVVMPAPDDPPSLGVLRDPVRARARFVRGRLALVIRTLEARLEEATPDRVGDVGVRGPGGWSFNREALNAVVGAHLLRGGAPMTLGGAPLTLEDLERIDGSVTFDAMARRVTRKRLLALLVRLRDFVRDRDLDLWQQGNDPDPWLDLLDSDDDETPEASLFDGWGQRMAIRRAPGGRARFTFLAPLPPGFELVSAGPDGRFGTGDDVVDPFARAVPSGSAYAEAVGEDALMSRLNRVEVSQATIQAVASLFEVETYAEDAGEGATSIERWDVVLPPLAEADEADRFERPWQTVTRSAARLGALAATSSHPVEVDDEPRWWALVAVAWTPEGWATLGRDRFRSGFPVVLTADALGRLGPDEPLLLPVVGARLPDGPQELLLSVEGSGAVRAEIEGAPGAAEAPVPLGPGGGLEARIRVTGEQEGRGLVRVVVRDSSGPGRRTLELPVEVRRPGSLRVQSAAAAVSGPTELRVELPRDAEAARSALVLAGPSALAADPALATWLERDPALIAWALSVSGQPIPDEVRRRLEAATQRNGTAAGETPALSTACAAVAWAAVDRTGAHWAPSATAGAVQRQGGDDELRTLSIDASILAALSVATAPDDASRLATTIGSIRDALRGAVRRHRDDPALLARGAAALLLADSRDVRGQTMLALARRRLVRGFRGGLAVDLSAEGEDGSRAGPTGRDGADQLAATAALAIAAHQAGDRELATELARGLAARAHVATALGGEPLFWLLAARAFGVFGLPGAGETLAVNVSQGDAPPRRIELGREAVVVPIELPRPGRTAVIRVEPVGTDLPVPLATTTATYVRPARRAEGGPLRVELEGDVGYAGERAAYVATISNAGAATVARPVLLVSLPAGAELDAASAEAMTRVEGAVVGVDEPDRRGVVRIRLAPLAAGQGVRLPLALHWTAAGRRSGLALAVFPEDRSWELTVAPPRDIDVPFRPESEL